jgi:hypothetical protein
VPGPLPQRIGDAERDRAAEYLRDHLAEGRLEQFEFDERLTAALTAKTQADLDPLFVDLPAPKPGQTLAPVAGPPSPWQQPNGVVVSRPAQVPSARLHASAAAAVLLAFSWPLMLMLIIALPGQPYWLMMLPFLLPWVLGRGHHNGPRRR